MPSVRGAADGEFAQQAFRKPIKSAAIVIAVLLMVLAATPSGAQKTGTTSPQNPGATAPQATGASTPQDLPKQLALSDAIRIALTNNSLLRTAQSRLDQASGRYSQSRSALLPQIGAGADQSYLKINLQGLGIDIPGVEQTSAPFGSFDARVILRQDLLNIASLQAWKSSRSSQDAFHQQVLNAREVVVLNVVGAYLQALRARASRDTLTEQTRLATELYKLTDDRVKQGVSSRLEANRALQEVNSLEQRLQEAEQGYTSAKLTLANALQARITSDFEVDDAAAYGVEGPIDRQAEVQTALATRPDYRAAQAGVKAAELQVQSVKASRYPSLATLFSDGQSGNSPVNNVNVFRLQATLTFPIYTSGRISGQIAEAQGSLHEAQAAEDQLRSQVETDVLAAISGVEWATKEVATSAANVKLSREEVELSRQRFAQGITDNTEVVNAQDRVSRADDARVRAMYTLGLARANLARATGSAEKTYRK